MLTLITELQELEISDRFNYNYDLASYQNRLYLAGISFNNQTENSFLKVFVYDNFKQTWEVIYNQSLTVKLNLNDYQLKLIKLNNLYKQNNLFLFFQTLDNCLIFRIEEGDILINVTDSSQHFISCINQPYLTEPDGIFLIEQIKQNNQQLINLKYWQDWSEKEPKIIKIFNEQNIKIDQIIKYQNTIYCGANSQSIGCELYAISLHKIEENNNQLQPIITKGAYRYSLNQKIFDLTTFKNCLYLACGLDFQQNNSEISSYLYKTGFELIRIYPDNDWDIITGNPKFSPQGLKVPLSALDCGFGDVNNNLVVSLFSDHNKLYLLTKNLEDFQLWYSDNGEDWQSKNLDFPLNNYLEVKVIKTLICSLGLIAILELNNLDQSKNTKIFLIKIE